jgi:PAS domain S-box-containing protein
LILIRKYDTFTEQDTSLHTDNFQNQTGITVNMISNNSIQAKFLLNMIFIAVASIVMWSLLWIQGEYTDYKTESERLRFEYIQSQKEQIKTAVTNRVQLIELRKAQAEKNLKITIKDRVYNAHLIALNIYKNNIEKIHDEIATIIKESLRPIRFDNGQGYYFAGSMDGIEILYPVRPEVEGKNVINLQDLKGNFVIQDEIKTIRESNEGFVTHYWSKPGSDPEKSFPKTSFVKYFEPLNWYFGTGAYLDEAKNIIQQQLLAQLSEARFNIDGYFFGSTYEGEPLFSNGKITIGQDSIWNLEDPNGIKIIQTQRAAVKNKHGGFVNYSWHKLDTSKPEPKISFVIGIPEWEWIIGADFYTGFIDKAMAEKKATMKAHLRAQITRSLLVLVILLAFIWFWSKRILKQIQKSINVFSSFLKKASTDSITINPNQIELQELKEIAILTNVMLENRLQAEEALLESEEKFRKMYEFTQVGIVRVSLDAKIIQANKAYCNMLGYAEKELIGKKLDQINQHHYIQDIIDLNKKLVTGEMNSFQIEKRYLHKDGKIIHGMLSATLIRDKQKKPQYFLGSVTDITPRKKAEKIKERLEAQLQQSHKMEAIGALAGGIAHDFNNVLFSIIGFTELTLDDMPEETLNKSNLNHILTAANRAKEMVQQILTFSRHTESEKKPVKIQSIIKEVVKLLKPSIPSTITIKEHIDKNCSPVFADSVQIHQVIMNLATNASHAMREKGGIMEFFLTEEKIDPDDLTIYPELHTGTYVKFIIRDTGHGIDSKTMGKIFNPYFTTKKVGEGTGMGLSVVHGIIANHDGCVVVESKPELGTEFHIFLPSVERITKIKQDSIPSQSIPTGTENILFVDDEEEITIMTKQLLERLGYIVASFTDSRIALEAFKKEPDKFDLVITDMTMPNMTGTELATKLLEINHNIKIILCSGYSELIDKETAKSMGIKKYVTKPITQKEIADTIRKVLKK